jgi:hypothetical protein
MNEKAQTEKLHEKINNVIEDFLVFIQTEDNYTDQDYFSFLEVVRMSAWKTMLELYSTIILNYSIKDIKEAKRIFDTDSETFQKTYLFLAKELVKNEKVKKAKTKKVNGMPEDFFD